MNFYDFCRCVELQPKSKRLKLKNTHESRLGVRQRHGLKAGHPLHTTHELLEHTNEDRGEMRRELVPRVVGMSIPRSSHEQAWALFTLLHFKPFSCDDPLFMP